VTPGPLYCALPQRERIWCVVLASVVSMLGPLSATIYLPAVDAISRELHASHGTINLSITVFMVRLPSQPALRFPRSC
jgi:hypothetical protein